MNTKTAVRFDSREIAVVFSLFVFVSLLMFTVGILVGKGLTQARYENKAPVTPGEAAIEPLVKTHPQPHAGASVSLGTPTHSPAAASVHAEKPSEKGHEKGHDEKTTEGAAHTAAATAASPEATPQTANHEASVAPEKAGGLKLIPLKPTQAQTAGANLVEPTSETDELLKNPKILSLVESDTPETTAQVRAPSSAIPAGGKHAFVVQIGSYPNEGAARDRVEALKKMGFQQAFFSAMELGAASGTWYRVLLGYYPDARAAKKAGDTLQARGEVKNYIVRKNN